MAVGLGAAMTFQIAEVSLAPPEPLPLGGYSHRNGAKFVSGGQTLRARSLLLSGSGKKIAIVSLEMLTVPESLVREVTAQIPKDVNLFLCATHTHCAPDSQMLNERMNFDVPGIARYKPKWLQWYAEKIANAVNDSLSAPRQSFSEATIEGGSSDNNRGRRKLAKPSKVVCRLSVEGQELLVSFSAHGTLHDENVLQLNGDWPGEVLARIKGVVLPGAIGDVSPKADGANADEQSSNLASALLNKLLPNGYSLTMSNPKLGFLTVPVSLPKPIAHPEFAKSYRVSNGVAQMAVQAFAPRAANISLARIGSLAIVGIPGEPTSELGERIRRFGNQLGFTETLVCSHVNGWTGYNLAPVDYDRGGYEGTLSFFGRDFGDTLVRSACKGLQILVNTP